jgi:hypothetical protein
MQQIDPFNLSYTPEVFDSMRSSKISPGVFQLGNSKTAHLCHKYKEINTIGHIIDLCALIRPSAQDTKDEQGKTPCDHYIARLNGDEDTEFVHPKLETILGNSYGVALFQEDNIRITADIAGFDLVKADLMRQAIGKKDFKKMESMHEDFVKGCQEHSGLDKEVAEGLFQEIRASARYQFNKCLIGSERLYGFGHTIGEMYRISHDLRYARSIGSESSYKKFKLKKYGKCWSLCSDGRVRKNRIVDIFYQGVRDVYTITLVDDRAITATENHKFPTPVGEKRLDELSPGDVLFCNDLTGHEKWNWKQDCNIPSNVPQKGQRGFQRQEFSHSRAMDAFRQENIHSSCDICGGSHRRMEIHHWNGDHYDSVEENMAWVCPSCHKKEHYKMGRVKHGERGLPTFLVAIKSIEYAGQEDVFDIEVSGEVSHTFMLETGIVTCNSHSTSYGTMACIELWFRYHYPHLFFATKISYAYIGISDKQKRNRLVKDLVRSAQERGIDTVPPDIDRRNIHTEFNVEANKLYLGFNCIAGTGTDKFAEIFKKIAQIEEKRGVSILEHSWLEILLYFSDAIGKTAMESFINLGIFDLVDPNREGLAYDYNDWIIIKKSKVAVRKIEEQQFGTLQRSARAILDAPAEYRKGLGKAQVEALQAVETISKINRPNQTSSDWILKKEDMLLGITVTSPTIGGGQVSEANCTLDELDKPRKDCIIAVYVKDLSIKKQKDGKDMAFLTVIDHVGHESSSVLMFHQIYSSYGDLVYPEGNYLMYGDISDRQSFLVRHVEYLEEKI